jgi:hypothetical protein
MLPSKSKGITYSECVSVALVVQSSVACLAVPYFSTLPQKRYDFRKHKFIEYETVFYFVCKLGLKNFSF